jgi:hypothetical protein
LIHVVGSFSNEVLAEVTADAKRGTHLLDVSQSRRFNPGDHVRLILTDTPDYSLANHLYAGDPGPVENLTPRQLLFDFRVARIDSRNGRIAADRPLRTDVRTEWKPRLVPAAGTVEEVGIENLTIEFPRTPYQGHFTEVGFNALAMTRARNCWAGRLRILNADSGIFLHSVQITLHDIHMASDREPPESGRPTGHHGITLGGQDCLLTRFEFRTRFIHDLTVTNGSAGNVASAGRGVDLCLDHHRYAPHSNLFTDLELGEGSRMFHSGGGEALGRHSAAHETFWNIRARRPQTWPEGWGPDRMNLVGVVTEQPSLTGEAGKWLEAIPPDRLFPPDLHQAQLKRRLSAATSK